MYKVKKNAKGGVLVTPEEVQAAFEFLDADAEGRVSVAALRRRLQVFFPAMTTKDYRVLMNNKKHITAAEIIELLESNDVAGFDPVQEAFSAFDPAGSGAISVQRLREVFSALGLGDLGQTEVDILLRVADVDGDGAITLEDFRYMLDLHARNQQAQQQQAGNSGGQGGRRAAAAASSTSAAAAPSGPASDAT